MSGIVFLQLNGYDFTASPDEFSEAVLSVADGRLEKSEITEFLRAHTKSFYF